MANTVDIAPELLEAITKEIQEAVEKDPVLQKVLQSIEDGTVTSADMYKYAERYGEIEADALSKYLTEENLPNGRLYQNIAGRTVTPTMRDAEQHVNHVAAEIQTAINKGAGLNIKGVEADVDMDHITGITKKLAYSDSIDRVSYLLRDPMITTLMHGVDRTIQKNVELHADAGLNPIVKRISVGGCCEWCQERAGTYDYIEDDLWNHGTEVYRRHNFCRCLVMYNPMDGKGKWQNVHHQQDWGSQGELSTKESARRQARIDVSKQVANEQFEKRSQREKRYNELINRKYDDIDRKTRLDYALLTQEDFAPRIPIDEADNFMDYEPLELTTKEREQLLLLRELGDTNGYEYAVICKDGVFEEPYTSNLVNAISVPREIEGTDVSLYHCHTNVTPLSGQDFMHMARDNVSHIGVIASNGDVFITKFEEGESVRPDVDELSEEIGIIKADCDAMFMYRDDLSPEEKTYMAIKETQYRISMRYQWKTMGGNIYRE